MSFRYRIEAEWSDDDACYVARVPALPNCSAPGRSKVEASEKVQILAEARLLTLGDKAPPPDAT